MWIIYAIGASMLWGVTYVLGEQLYKKISITTSIAATGLAALIVLSLLAAQQGYLKRDIATLMSSKGLMFLFVTHVAVFVLAEICIALSITNKNATLAGLVEISYPIFIALFAYFIFKENSLNISSVAGGLLIFSGIFVIYHFNH